MKKFYYFLLLLIPLCARAENDFDSVCSNAGGLHLQAGAGCKCPSTGIYFNPYVEGCGGKLPGDAPDCKKENMKFSQSEADLIAELETNSSRFRCRVSDYAEEYGPVSLSYFSRDRGRCGSPMVSLPKSTKAGASYFITDIGHTFFGLGSSIKLTVSNGPGFSPSHIECETVPQGDASGAQVSKDRGRKVLSPKPADSHSEGSGGGHSAE
jgi:hypothetical protein